MVNGELANLIAVIRNIPLDETLSDDALMALARSYVSMQNLVVANGLDAEYGNRRDFERALDILYRICVERCRGDQPFGRRCRMTPVLYMIVYMQMRGVDMKRSCECGELMQSLVGEWMHSPEVRGESGSIYGVLRCISNLCYYRSGAERDNDEAFRWFRQCIGDWASSMGGDGRWAGVASGEALCRIEVMGRNSNMFLDTANDDLIERSRTSYCNSVVGSLRRSDGVTMRGCGVVLFMLYEVMMWGVGTPDYGLVEAVAEAAKRLAGQYPCGSAEWLLCQSTVIDRLCMQVGDEIGQQMLTNIA